MTSLTVWQFNKASDAANKVFTKLRQLQKQHLIGLQLPAIVSSLKRKRKPHHEQIVTLAWWRTENAC